MKRYLTILPALALVLVFAQCRKATPVHPLDEVLPEPSPLIPLDEQRKDTLTVTLDKPSGLLFVKGYSATDYIIPLIGKEGCYHSREIWLYRDQLRNNIALRTARYLK